MSKLKRKHMKYFKQQVQKFQRVFGLHRYQIFFGWQKNDCDYLACCITQQAGAVATMYLARNWQGTRPTKKELRRTAFHETMELFLSNMDRLCNARFLQPEEIEEDRHRIIRTLEKVFLEQFK